MVPFPEEDGKSVVLRADAGWTVAIEIPDEDFGFVEFKEVRLIRVGASQHNALVGIWRRTEHDSSENYGYFSIRLAEGVFVCRLDEHGAPDCRGVRTRVRDFHQTFEPAGMSGKEELLFEVNRSRAATFTKTGITLSPWTLDAPPVCLIDLPPAIWCDSAENPTTLFDAWSLGPVRAGPDVPLSLSELPRLRGTQWFKVEKPWIYP